ncbi:hypothetical protein RhiirA4_408395 [Rhizophagus irregularis]|uniref:Uncharacterized protein n=1 Tax=Rhizophagus irregularis TaxID=588596 RepID=A0A2I1H119_9GLOM|nr:hypothetical protein RhiirA4_408395 [Rhizophagus irregularis]
MTEQPLITSTNNNILSRLPRNGKNNSTCKNYPLTEENLKLHTGMVPSSRETKAHFVLIYVDLQKQLVALEAQLKKEAEEAKEKFNASLPENTPPVIPEVIHVPQSPQTSSPTFDDEVTSSFPTNDVICSNEPEISSPKSIEEIPSLLDSVIKNGRKSQRIKNLFKKTVDKLTLIIKRSSNDDDNNLTPHFDREIASLNVELSVPPSPSQSTVRSRRNSSSRPKAPFKSIFIPHSSKSTHNRTNSADTTNTLSIHPTSLSSSLNNNAYSSVQNSPLLPPLLTSNTNTHLNSEIRNDLSSSLPFSNNSSPPSPNNEKCENDVCKTSPEYRDSGISLVPPGGRSGHHSREHSISSILRKVGNFHAFQKDNQHHDGHRREKSWGPFSSIIIGSKDNEMQLLAFRYPSIQSTDIYVDSRDFGGMEDQDNSSCSGGAFVSEFDGMSGKQKDRERSVTFDLDDQQPSTSDEETGLNKRKRCSTINKNAQSTIIPMDFSDNIMKEIDALNISHTSDIK